MKTILDLPNYKKRKNELIHNLSTYNPDGFIVMRANDLFTWASRARAWLDDYVNTHGGMFYGHAEFIERHIESMIANYVNAAIIIDPESTGLRNIRRRWRVSVPPLREFCIRVPYVPFTFTTGLLTDLGKARLERSRRFAKHHYKNRPRYNYPQPTPGNFRDHSNRIKAIVRSLQGAANGVIGRRRHPRFSEYPCRGIQKEMSALIMSSVSVLIDLLDDVKAGKYTDYSIKMMDVKFLRK